VNVELQEKGYNAVAKQTVPLAVIEPLELRPNIPMAVATGSIVQYSLIRFRDGLESGMECHEIFYSFLFVQWCKCPIRVSNGFP